MIDIVYLPEKLNKWTHRKGHTRVLITLKCQSSPASPLTYRVHLSDECQSTQLSDIRYHYKHVRARVHVCKMRVHVWPRVSSRDTSARSSTIKSTPGTYSTKSISSARQRVLEIFTQRQYRYQRALSNNVLRASTLFFPGSQPWKSRESRRDVFALSFIPPCTSRNISPCKIFSCLRIGLKKKAGAAASGVVAAEERRKYNGAQPQRHENI